MLKAKNPNKDKKVVEMVAVLNMYQADGRTNQGNVVPSPINRSIDE